MTTGLEQNLLWQAAYHCCSCGMPASLSVQQVSIPSQNFDFGTQTLFQSLYFEV
jgi:hypothetical protein